MKKSFLLLLILLFSSFCSFSQVARTYEFGEIEKRPLLVVLQETENSNANAEVEKINQIFKNSIQQYWTFNKDITYITISELENLGKKKREQLKTHAVLSLLTLDIRKTTKITSGPTEHKRVTTFANDWNACALNVGLLEDAVKNYYSYHHTFSTLQPTEVDIVSGITQMQHYIQKCRDENRYLSFKSLSEMNGSELHKVTLLLDKSKLNHAVTEQMIYEKYGLPFKVVSAQEVEKVILNRTPGFAYVGFLPIDIYHPHFMMQLIVSADSGNVIGWSRPPVYRTNYTSHGLFIGEKDLKSYSKYTKKKS